MAGLKVGAACPRAPRIARTERPTPCHLVVEGGPEMRSEHIWLRHCHGSMLLRMRRRKTVAGAPLLGKLDEGNVRKTDVLLRIATLGCSCSDPWGLETLAERFIALQGEPRRAAPRARRHPHTPVCGKPSLVSCRGWGCPWLLRPGC